ncbi:MAG TPA: M48 family metallopeptidase [Terracidiphilus sp.]
MVFVRARRRAFLSAVLLAVLIPTVCYCQGTGESVNAPPGAPAGRSSSPRDAYTLPPADLAKAVALSRIQDVLAFGGSLWGITFLWLLLATGAAAATDGWTQRVLRRRWIQGLLFFALFLLAAFLAGLPFDWFAQYSSRSYGISVQGWPSWTRDEATSLAISLLIGAPLLLFFNWMVRRWPRRFWFAAWLISLPLMVIAVFAEPLIIDPLFNKFEPLQKTDPALVLQLEKVVRRTRIDIPPSRMFLMKASAKTNGINAYVTGIGPSKRIVVWDTTADRVPTDQILFIFGHESGHYVLHHIPKGLAISAVCLFFGFWICAGLAFWVVRRCGSRWHINSLADRSGFIVLLFVLSVAGFLAEPGANAVSRHFEHQADIFGQEAIHGIVPDPQKTAVSAFNVLGRIWLENPHPSSFVVFWLYSHPSVQARAHFAAHFDPWADGGHGRYFNK